MELLNLSMDNSNSSSSLGYPNNSSWIYNSLIPSLVLSFCFLLGVPGNIAVIILRPNWQHLSTLSQNLMLNLAISDLLCLLTLPLWIYTLLYGWSLGLVPCRLLTYVIYCCLYSSLMTVTALSVQRYLKVVYLQKNFSQAEKRRQLVLLWLVAMVLSIPSLVVRQTIMTQQWTICGPHFSSSSQQVAVLLAESLPGFVSITVVAGAYIKLYRKVNQGAFFNNPQTTRLVTSIIVTFVVLWMPYHITNVLGVAAILLDNKSLYKFCLDSWDIFGALVFVNSSLNPLLYAFVSRNMMSLYQRGKRRYCC